MRNTFGRKVHLGRLALPVWAIALAVIGVAAVAGQAVGPVLSGSVQGSAGLVVSQTVKLAVVNAAGTALTPIATVGTTNDDFAATWNDEGTAFTVAIETQVGQTSQFTLALENLSGKDANAILELNVPAGIDADAEGADQASSFAQLNRNTYLFKMTAGVADATADITVTVESKDDAAPGFYTISGRIIQVAN